MPTVYVTAPPEAAGDLARTLVEDHPYDVPCVERFEEADLHDPFREWRDGAVE